MRLLLNLVSFSSTDAVLFLFIISCHNCFRFSITAAAFLLKEKSVNQIIKCRMERIQIKVERKNEYNSFHPLSADSDELTVVEIFLGKLTLI